MHAGNEKRIEIAAPEGAGPAPAPAPANVAVAAAAAPGEALPESPARALQDRLARELSPPAQSWLWHTAGLVLTLLLSFSTFNAWLGLAR